MKKQFIYFGIGALLFDYFYINKVCEIKPMLLSYNPFKKLDIYSSNSNGGSGTSNNNNLKKNELVPSTRVNDDDENSTLFDLYKDQVFYHDYFITEITIKNNKENNNNKESNKYSNNKENNEINEITIEDFTKAFFTSPIFTPELTLFSTKKEDINNKMKFIVGESIKPFEIINKKSENNEILLHAREQFNALTWLKVVKVNKGKKTQKEEEDVTCYELHYRCGLVNRSYFNKVLFTTLFPFHYVYARYLLAGAKQMLQQKFNE